MKFLVGQRVSHSEYIGKKSGTIISFQTNEYPPGSGEMIPFVSVRWDQEIELVEVFFGDGIEKIIPL